jgi:hypothetical protein
MDLWMLLALIAAIAVVMLALARILVRPSPPAEEAVVDSPIAVSTEGMKVCPKCGMGNMWTESRCITCGSGLKG